MLRLCMDGVCRGGRSLGADCLMTPDALHRLNARSLQETTACFLVVCGASCGAVVSCHRCRPHCKLCIPCAAAAAPACACLTSLHACPCSPSLRCPRGIRSPVQQSKQQSSGASVQSSRAFAEANEQLSSDTTAIQAVCTTDVRVRCAGAGCGQRRYTHLGCCDQRSGPCCGCSLVANSRTDYRQMNEEEDVTRSQGCACIRTDGAG